MFREIKKYIGPRRLALIGLIGLLCMLPSQEGTAQESLGEGEIFLPFVSGNASTTQTGQDGTDVQSEHDHDHTGIGHIPEHGRFTANDGAEQSWPPQVKYIQDIENDDTVQAAARQTSEVYAASAVTIQNATIENLLGNRHVRINTVPIKEKWDDTIRGHRVTYFSYSNNQTIEATVVDNAVESIKTFSPGPSAG